MDYAYKVTTHGRNAMAAYMALGDKPFHITRVAFGSGLVDGETNLADVHQLVEYVSDGAIAGQSHQDDRFLMTIQFANSQHKDVPTFLLSEFMVYVEDPDSGQETDLLYGTLGDYRQPVPGYNPAYPPSVFNFPLTLILSDELNVEVSAPAGLVTWDDLEAHNTSPDAHPDIREAARHTSLYIGAQEPETGPMLWFNTGAVPETDAVVLLKLGGENDASNVAAAIDGKNHPVMNAAPSDNNTDHITVEIKK